MLKTTIQDIQDPRPKTQDIRPSQVVGSCASQVCRVILRQPAVHFGVRVFRVFESLGKKITRKAAATSSAVWVTVVLSHTCSAVLLPEHISLLFVLVLLPCVRAWLLHTARHSSPAVGTCRLTWPWNKNCRVSGTVCVLRK